jgi:hypothetical protein
MKVSLCLCGEPVTARISYSHLIISWLTGVHNRDTEAQSYLNIII